MSTRHLALTLAKACGLFALARILTRRGLRILCYHGIALDDEHVFQPILFMREDTFRQRMEYLVDRGYPVLALGHALELLPSGHLPPSAVVITFDDGWVGTGSKAAPILGQLGLPSTLYVATKHVQDRAPVSDVTLRYLLWKCRDRGVSLATLGLDPTCYSLTTAADRERVMRLIGESVAETDTDALRETISHIARSCGMDWQTAESRGLMCLLSPDQLAALPEHGMELQLHTHQHRLPLNDRGAVATEIVTNREILQQLTDDPLVHFCYPSGAYHPRQFEWLRALDVASATTCIAGFNYPTTEPLALHRFLDGENITPVEFEAELSGFLELMRQGRRALKSVISHSTTA
jgi:peptidoglycan/xylan/chitin deacetylase (PgdA/CDA1 family)